MGQAIRIHPTSMVSSKAVIRVCGGGSITVGRNCEIHDFAIILTYGGDIVIGDHCSVNPFTVIYGHGGTRIGNGVRIAAHSVIIPANHVAGTSDRPLHASGVTAQGIDIADDVWIGAGVTVLDGVRIGPHSIIGAGSVVTRSVPGNAVAMGVPARVRAD
jgi:acetyltransferase-like isoleucine patch superfamily enzyme